jgi:hypothetical protein
MAFFLIDRTGGKTLITAKYVKSMLQSSTYSAAKDDESIYSKSYGSSKSGIFFKRIGAKEPAEVSYSDLAECLISKMGMSGYEKLASVLSGPALLAASYMAYEDFISAEDLESLAESDNAGGRMALIMQHLQDKAAIVSVMSGGSMASLMPKVKYAKDTSSEKASVLSGINAIYGKCESDASSESHSDDAFTLKSLYKMQSSLPDFGHISPILYDISTAYDDMEEAASTTSINNASHNYDSGFIFQRFR